jgi:hypothetical protein
MTECPGTKSLTMPPNPEEHGGPTIRPIGFYVDDETNLKIIRVHLERTRVVSEVRIAGVARFALGDVAAPIGAKGPRD